MLIGRLVPVRVVVCFPYNWSGEHEIESGKDEKDSSCGLVLMHFSFLFWLWGRVQTSINKGFVALLFQFQDSDASHGERWVCRS